MGSIENPDSKPTAALKDQKFGYVQAKSMSGNTFVVGYPVDQVPKDPPNEMRSGEDNGEIKLSAVTGTLPYETDVNWTVGTHQISAEDNLRWRAGINSYEVQTDGSWWYKYDVNIHVNTPLHYHFTDESGDTYDLNTWVQGWHKVSYNSSKPTIKHVKAA